MPKRIQPQTYHPDITPDPVMATSFREWKKQQGKNNLLTAVIVLSVIVVFLLFALIRNIFFGVQPQKHDCPTYYTTIMDEKNEEWSISKLDGVYYVAGDNIMFESDTVNHAFYQYMMSIKPQIIK